MPRIPDGTELEDWPPLIQRLESSLLSIQGSISNEDEDEDEDEEDEDDSFGI